MDEIQNDNLKNARLAGWSEELWPTPPFDHGTPPEIDPELGNNGIKPTDAEPLFGEVE